MPRYKGRIVENWKDIEGYAGLYQVSNLGRVKSSAHTTIDRNGKRHVVKGQILKPTVGKFGYARIRIYKSGKQKVALLHRLVAQVFIDNPENKPEVNHKNGIKSDNSAINLEWVTRSENLKHAYNSGLYERRTGERHNRSKLTEDQVAKIKLLYKKGKYTVSALAKKFSTCQTNVSSILNGLTWKEVG